MIRPQRKRNRPRGYRPLARKPGTLTQQEAAEQNESRRNGPVIVRRSAAATKPAPVAPVQPASELLQDEPHT